MIRILLVIITLSISQNCLAHTDNLKVEILKFSINSNDEYVLEIKPIDSKERRIIYIRYDPKRAVGNEYLELTLDKYRESIKLLESSFMKTSEIEICRLSGIGYSPIDGKTGEFRTNALFISERKGQYNFVCFCHSVYGTSPD